MKTKPGQFDLAERTAQFGECVIRFSRTVRVDPVTVSLIKQLVRSATSIGANDCEADEAGSRKEFRYRISVCTREVRECKHWLQPTLQEPARTLWHEADELNRIFAAIARNTRI